MQMEMEMENQVMRYTYGQKERRKRMQNMFENLQALLPQLRPKARGASGLDQLISGVFSVEDIFDELLNQVDVTEEQTISIFFANLKLDIEVQVRMLAPRTLMRANNQAKLAEQSLKLQQGHTQALMTSSRALLPTPSNSWGNGECE
ncbi:hypothetical protein CQW23_09522 [Capsicum baccatum]|uniref:BHLH domain-containing protein n=1 Tax=Capsicum baccatum TaxID=33114 RepID=A0A2G2WX25_CAPBA|nr:hypothetical protein CQW23_09522 [Capsicum baccatum]